MWPWCEVVLGGGAGVAGTTGSHCKDARNDVRASRLCRSASLPRPMIEILRLTAPSESKWVCHSSHCPAAHVLGQDAACSLVPPATCLCSSAPKLTRVFFNAYASKHVPGHLIQQHQSPSPFPSSHASSLLWPLLLSSSTQDPKTPIPSSTTNPPLVRPANSCVPLKTPFPNAPGRRRQ